MPVVLKDIPCEKLPASSPNPLFWGLLLVLAMLFNAAVVLLCWPQGQTAEGSQFWFLLVGPAALGWLVAMLARSLYWTVEQKFIDDFNQQRNARIQKEIARGRRFLYILDDASIVASHSGDVGKFQPEGKAVLAARETPQGQIIRHTPLPREGSTEVDFLLTLFQRLLFDMDKGIRRLPTDCVLYVSLQVNTLLSSEEVRQCWSEAGETSLPHRKVVLQMEKNGLAAVDNWLDNYYDDVAALLIVSVQLNQSAVPLPESAEAAVGVLFTNVPMFEGDLALLHRPEHSNADDVETSISQALIWAREDEPYNVETLWMSGLDREGKGIGLWMRALESPTLKKLQQIKRKDVDRLIGNAGLASSWLGVIAAREGALATRHPQIVLSHLENASRPRAWISVVSPTSC